MIKCHNMNAIIAFVDFKKACDSINRSRIFKILSVYSIPSSIIDIISVLHADTCVRGITPDVKSFKYPKEYYRATHLHLSYPS